MKTILVTGGAGFIGNCFCKLLLKERKDWKVVNVDSLTYAANPNTIKEELNNPNYKFYKVDIRDRKAIEDIFEKEKPAIWNSCYHLRIKGTIHFVYLAAHPMNY